MPSKIGIMQGRLSPPVGESIQGFPAGTWRAEFAAAEQAGLSHIEWIFDRDGDQNPISSAAGIAEILALSDRHHVRVPSLCADYFMSELLLDGSPTERQARSETLRLLIENCARAKMRHVVLPFVDRSKIQDQIQSGRLVELMRSLLPGLESSAMEIHLETCLAPKAFSLLLNEIGSPRIKINHDTGNSASLGYDPGEEFAFYGNRIGSIHLKDRVRGGTTVPLGRGDANFPLIARLVKQTGFAGSFTLQVARGEPGQEIAWARQNLAFWREVESKA